jgi:hypothetical protein
MNATKAQARIAGVDPQSMVVVIEPDRIYHQAAAHIELKPHLRYSVRRRTGEGYSLQVTGRRRYADLPDDERFAIARAVGVMIWGAFWIAFAILIWKAVIHIEPAN